MPKTACPHCDKSLVNLRGHITKIHEPNRVVFEAYKDGPYLLQRLVTVFYNGIKFEITHEVPTIIDGITLVVAGDPIGADNVLYRGKQYNSIEVVYNYARESVTRVTLFNKIDHLDDPLGPDNCDYSDEESVAYLNKYNLGFNRTVLRCKFRVEGVVDTPASLFDTPQ